MELQDRINATGGATYLVATGEFIESGYAVGIASIAIVPDWVNRQFQATELSFVLGQNPFGILGFWLNPESGNLEIDRVEIVSLKSDAHDLAVRWNQLAYANLDAIHGKSNGESIVYV